MTLDSYIKSRPNASIHIISITMPTAEAFIEGGKLNFIFPKIEGVEKEDLWNVIQKKDVSQWIIHNDNQKIDVVIQ